MFLIFFLISFRLLLLLLLLLLQTFKILLAEPAKSLRFLMTEFPSKEGSILDHMRDLIVKFVNKGLLQFAYVHSLLWEYTQEVEGISARMDDLVTQLAESGPFLMATKAGAKVMVMLISHAGAKDRKRMIKTLKGKVLESLLHHSGYLAIQPVEMWWVSLCRH